MPVQYSLLLTATLCLAAFGVVMVFSASSTTSLLGETGDGAYYLKRTLIFGAIGLVGLKILSVHGVKLVRPLTGALLGIAVLPARRGPRSRGRRRGERRHRAGSAPARSRSSPRRS